jgi:hypothetical protein
LGGDEGVSRCHTGNPYPFKSTTGKPLGSCVRSTSTRLTRMFSVCSSACVSGYSIVRSSTGIRGSTNTEDAHIPTPALTRVQVTFSKYKRDDQHYNSPNSTSIPRQVRKTKLRTGGRGEGIEALAQKSGLCFVFSILTSCIWLILEP